MASCGSRSRLYLVYCGCPSRHGRVLWHPLPTYIAAMAAVDEQQYTMTLVYCGTLVYSGSAAVGVDLPQYKPFYTVPCYTLVRLFYKLELAFLF